MENAEGCYLSFEENQYDSTGGESSRNEQLSVENLFWDFKINILGKKDETIIHFCDECKLPIRIYGRMIPCKHAFCYACAMLHGKEGDMMCPACGNSVQQIQKHSQGSLLVCSTVQGCKRSYLSQRDLEAHINFRHMRAGNSVPQT